MQNVVILSEGNNLESVANLMVKEIEVDVLRRDLRHDYESVDDKTKNRIKDVWKHIIEDRSIICRV